MKITALLLAILGILVMSIKGDTATPQLAGVLIFGVACILDNASRKTKNRKLRSMK